MAAQKALSHCIEPSCLVTISSSSVSSSSRMSPKILSVRSCSVIMLVEASMNIDDFMEEMGILSYEDLESEDFTTLGGLAMFLIGRIPKAGDIFTYKNLQFEVVDMDRGRVDKLLVIKRDDEQE